MRPPSAPVFLERRNYRRRRLTDAARILPVLGGFLFMVPLLWGTGGSDGPGTGRGGIYLFAVWGLLILGAAALSRPLSRAERAGRQTGDGATEDRGTDDGEEAA